MRAEAEAEEQAEIAKKIAISQKKKEQELKKAQEEAEKAERVHYHVVTRETNAEMGRLGKIQWKRLFG
jgi:hypothetical protein